MKNTIRLFGTLSFKLCVIVLVAAVGLVIAACDNGTTSTVKPEPPVDLGTPVDLISVTAIAGAPTRTITLKFSAAIPLALGDVTLNPGNSNKIVTLSNPQGSDGNKIWTFKVDLLDKFKGGDLTVRVSKSNYRVAGF